MREAGRLLVGLACLLFLEVAGPVYALIDYFHGHKGGYVPSGYAPLSRLSITNQTERNDG